MKKEKTNIRRKSMKSSLMNYILMIISLFHTFILKLNLARALKFSLPQKKLAKSIKLFATIVLFLVISAILALAGNIVAKYGQLNVTGNLVVADNALFVDSANKRVGIGTNEPGYKLEVNGKIYSSDDICIGGKCLSTAGLNNLFFSKSLLSYDGSLGGYSVANSICDNEFPGSHMCTVNEILNTMIYGGVSDINEWSGTAWIAGGPPGYTADANDCLGFTSNNYDDLGRFWDFDDTTNDGMGWLTSCNQQKPIACCMGVS